ncbi:MAG TPA: hypothetical protein VNK24_03150 [Elusimicrobiota bacterium]|nr:hypothetical protein [Elusimicrobiota bacterium]
MPHGSPDLPPPKPEAVERALAFCRARGSFIFREVQNEFNFGRDELIAVMNALYRGDFIEKHGPARDGQPEWRMKPGAPGTYALFLSASAPSVPSVPAAKPWDPKRYGAKDYDHPDVQYWVGINSKLYWLAAVLGVACMADTLRQGLSFGLWPPFEPLYYFYFPVLTAYAAARDKEKRVRRAQAYEKRMGDLFLWAWVGILIFIWIYDWGNHTVFVPRTLYATLAAVFGVYAGVKIVAPAIWPIVPFDPDDPNDPDAPPQPAPGPEPLPGPGPAPLPGPTPNPTPDPGDDDGPEGNGRSSSGPILLAAYKNLGVFSIEDVARATGLTLPVIKGHLGQMVRWGHVQKEPGGKFRWLG